MTLAWLKSYMPRSLYGRATLILIAPVFVAQLVFGVVFIQNHFERVTAQLTSGVKTDLAYLFQRLVDDGFEATRNGPARDLEYVFSQEAPPTSNRRLFYDVSIFIVVRELETAFDVLGYDAVSEHSMVQLWLDRPDGPLRVQFRRARVSASNAHQLVLWTIVAGVLMYFVALVFLRNQVRPIRRLARAAEAFGRGESTDYAPSGATEVRAAGASFLAMRNRIERHIEQRTMMLSGVSHDLRTPLTRLRLGLEMMDDDTDLLRRDVDEMQHMLDVFLAYVRDDMEEPQADVDLRKLLAETVEKYARIGEDVVLVAGPAPLVVSLQPSQVTRTIDNLITNALRYGARAEVSMVLFERSVRIRVEDDGPGIPEADRSQALKPFARLDEARNQNQGGGVGLGLAIAADVARAHGGSLRLGDSDRLGGLSVDVILPLARRLVGPAGLEPATKAL